MPAIVVPATAKAVGPGYLYRAPLGTAFPANTVVGSVFTDAWSAGWVPIGITKSGSEFSYKISTDNVEAAEYLDPLSIETTGREIGYGFEMMQILSTSFKLAFNGGTTTVTGATTTLLTKFVPPVVGGDVRTMLGWESVDGTERLLIRQALNTGDVKISRKKAPDAATLPADFSIEQPGDGSAPFEHYFAGAIRGA